MTAKNLVDLSHTVAHGTITYKGLPAPLICDFLSREASKKLYAEGTTFHIGKIEMVANTGTYLDSPFHRYADGHDISELPLEKLADLDAVRVKVMTPRGRAVGPEVFGARSLLGKAVLVQTEWSRHWGTDQYFEGHSYLTEAAAEHLVRQRAVLVGIDSYNIDDTGDGQRPVHTKLLGAGIPIVEHMCNLDLLPFDDFRLSAVPAKIKGMGTFPVRAYARW
ncbi:MAG TPA: cyclase family protein [Candidatus Koribacter sp.]|jgi:kynurenine formamidase